MICLCMPQDALKCKTCPDKAASVCTFIAMLIALYALGVFLGNREEQSRVGTSEEEHSRERTSEEEHSRVSQ